MDYAIRLFRDGDAEALCELALAAIREVGRHGYSEEQVEAWAARHPGAEMYHHRAAAGDIILVAADANDRPVAYAVLEPDGHLDRLFSHPLHTRRGLADRLLAAAEEYASRLGLGQLYTEASELARPSFERAGYALTHRRDFQIAGVQIHNYAMVKPLG